MFYCEFTYTYIKHLILITFTGKVAVLSGLCTYVDTNAVYFLPEFIYFQMVKIFKLLVKELCGSNRLSIVA